MAAPAERDHVDRFSSEAISTKRAVRMIKQRNLGGGAAALRAVYEQSAPAGGRCIVRMHAGPHTISKPHSPNSYCGKRTKRARRLSCRAEVSRAFVRSPRKAALSPRFRFVVPHPAPGSVLSRIGVRIGGRSSDLRAGPARLAIVSSGCFFPFIPTVPLTVYDAQ